MQGEIGKTVPVFCYTSWPMAELFVNGVSQGVKTFEKGQAPNSGTTDPANSAETMRRYRLMWPDVVYQPGEIEVVAYDAKGLAGWTVGCRICAVDSRTCKAVSCQSD